MRPQSISKLEVDIKNYERIKRINKGGFGTIYKVKDKISGIIYAAKVIDCGDDQEECDKIIDREVGILFYSKHPTIIKFIGYSTKDFLEENNITIIMELAANGSLQDILKKIQNHDGPKNYCNTNRQIILIGVSRGMKYLHDRNILHRDLKPGNILLDSDFKPHITDFGLSKVVELGHSYSQSLVVGTLPYMAPELFKGNQCSQKTDIYSFGILMYEVVTDLPPFPDLENKKITEYEFKGRVMNDNYRPVFKFPIKKCLRNLIEKCWSNNATERTNFDEIYRILTNINDDDCILEDVEVDELKDYIDDIDQIKDNIDHLLKRIEELEKENRQLKADNEAKNDQIQLLLQENDKLKKQEYQKNLENQKLKEKITALKENEEQNNNKIQQLKMINDEKNKEIQQLKEKIHQLKENEKLKNIEIQQLKLDSDNTKKSILKQKIFVEQNECEENEDISTSNESKSRSIEKSQPIKPSHYLANQTENTRKNAEESKKSQHKIEQHKIKEKITVLEFNSFSLEKQQSIALNLVRTSSDQTNIFFNKIEKLINYFFTIDKLKESIGVLELISPVHNLGEIDDRCQIRLKFPAVKLLINNGSFHSTEFIDILKTINQICFEIKYPYESFDNNYNKVVEFREKGSLSKNIKICIFISGIEKTDYRFTKDENINIVIFDSTVTSICGKRVFEKNPHTLTQIGSFSDCSSLTQIAIPSSVTSIEKSAFSGCSSLTQITIPSSVTSIGDYAFKGCSSLKEISIPSSEILIESFSFEGCSSLTQISIPFVTYIGSSAFKGCSSLKEIAIPSSVTKIKFSAFEGCSSLTQITIPSSVTQIEFYAFSGCSSLKEIAIPSSVIQIGTYAFKGCSSLTQIIIPSSITQIEFSVFEECSSLKEITIPSSVTQIGSSSFKGCPSLTQIIIPSSVTQIESFAFYGCSSLKKITIPSSIIQIESSAFKGCSSLVQIAIPSSVTQIESSSFSGCSSLKEIKIPSSVIQIGSSAFKGCSSLKEIKIPSSVIQIGSSAFEGCSSLTQITIPFSVKQVESSSFSGCSSLEKITIPSSVTQIENSAFFGCSSLKEITIPSSVTQIGYSAFQRCSSLTQITIPFTLKSNFSQFVLIPKVKINYV